MHAECARFLYLAPRGRNISPSRSCEVCLQERAHEEREVAVAPDVVGDRVVQISDAQGGGEEAPGRAVNVVYACVAVRGEGEIVGEEGWGC